MTVLNRGRADSRHVLHDSVNTTAHPLSRAFMVAHGTPPREASNDDPTPLEDLLRSALESARGKWPSVALGDGAFIAFLASKAPTYEALVPFLRRLHTGDLYLACAAGRGDPQAIGAIEREHVLPLRAAMARQNFTESLIDDVQQAARERLFVTDRKISTYDGRGTLRGWLRVVFMRDALHATRKADLEARPADDIADFPTSNDDPEMAYLKELYRKEFAEAFALALGDLSHRQRNVLRQHTVFGVTIDGLAVMYRVHRATAARWLDGAREALLAGTRRELTARLNLSAENLDSIMRLIESQIDISVRRLFSR